MRELAIAPAGEWYVLTYFGGVFRSDDSGATWHPCGSVASEGIDVAQDGTVWSAGPDVHASGDQCRTWTATDAPRATLDIGIYGSEVWAVGDQGIWLRTGLTWSQRSTPIDGSLFSRFGGNPLTARVAGTLEAGIVVSTDGMNWVQRPTQSMHVNKIAASGTSLFVYTGADGSSTGGVDCSSGPGVTWTACDNDGGTTLAADPLEPQHVVFAIYDDLAETKDAFGQVTRGMREMSGLTDAIVRDLTFTPAGTLVAASERGVFASPPGPLAFQSRMTGISAWTIDKILVDGTDVYLGTEAGPLRSQNGQPFQMSLDGIKFATRASDLAFAPDGTLVATSRMIWKSNDRGASWQMAAALDIPDSYNARSVAFAGTRAIVGTNTRILVADPPYTTWTPRSVAGNPVNDVLAIGDLVYLASDGGLFVSPDRGDTVQPVTAVAISSHSVAMLASGALVVATDVGLWVSDATRTTWTTVNGAIYYDEVVSDGTRIVALASFKDEVLYSPDGGGTWATQRLPVHPRTVAIDTDDSLVIGTYGHGLMRVPLP